MNISTLRHFLSPLARELRITRINIKLLLSGRKKVESSMNYTVISNFKAHTYFGYYDITPFKGDKLIYVVKKNDKNQLEVIVDDVKHTNPKCVDVTQAWNWQQGCRLRWFPGNNDVVSFNKFEDGKYFNSLLNLETNQSRRIDWPLYDIDKNGELGLSVDFERLGRLRPGYGYNCIGKDMTKTKNHGIDIISIKENKLLLTLSYDRIVKSFDKKVDIDNCYLNHLSFSPDSKKFLFFLIEIINGYHMAYLLVYNLEKDEIILLDEKEKVSHYVWKDGETIICTAYKNPSLCRYYSYFIPDRSKTLLASKSLTRDGHPSMVKNVNSILTDTYPDSFFYQHLMIVDLDDDKTQEIVSIYSDPHVRGERRTDLHPRFNDSQTLVSIDANISKYRKLYIFNLK